MSGVLEGGWEYVWLAYGASGVAFVGYTLSVLMRYREERQRRAREAASAAAGGLKVRKT